MKKQNKQEKKKFGRFFRRRFLITLPAAAALLGWFVFRPSWEDCTNRNPRDFTERRSDDSGQEEPENKHESRLQSADAGTSPLITCAADYLTWISETGGSIVEESSERAVMLCHPETGEIIAGAPYAIAEIWQNEEKKYYSLRDQALLKQLAAGRNAFDYSDSGNYCIDHIYSIYVKDDQFVPGEVFFAEDSIFPHDYFRRDGGRLRGEWVDLWPADKSGWTKIEGDRSREYLSVFHKYSSADDENRQPEQLAKKLSTDGQPHIGQVFLYGNPDAPRAEELIARMKAELPGRTKELVQSRDEDIHEAIYGGVETRFHMESWNAETREELVLSLRKHYDALLLEQPMKIYSEFKPTLFTEKRRGYINGRYEAIGNYEAGTEEVQFRGETWLLFHFQYVDPKKLFGYLVLAEVPLMILPFLIAVTGAALVWSVIAYLLYSRRYDIEAYRRNLTGALAHDLKTPLAVIYGHAENIRAHTHPESEDEYADCIMENVTHMDEMIAGVLDLAQLEGRAAPAMKEKLDLTELLHAAFLRNAGLMEQRGLTLTESGQLTVKGNPDMLAQLCENLAANAVQHTAEGGAVTVTAEKRSIRISNPYTGELDAKKLCEPFKRGDAARGSQSGSGLGLSIVQQIAALHKLRLRVTAKDGIFTVELKRRRFR